MTTWIVDTERRIQEGSRELPDGTVPLGRFCYEVTFGRDQPCPRCPIHTCGLLREGEEDVRLERLEPGGYDLVRIRQLLGENDDRQRYVCAHRPVHPAMARAVERLVRDGRREWTAEWNDLLANKVQGLMLGLELLGPDVVGRPRARRLVRQLEDVCDDLIRECGLTRCEDEALPPADLPPAEDEA